MWYVVIGVLLLIIIVQIILLLAYQRQIKDICRQLSFLNKHDSNMILTHQINWGSISTLTAVINKLLEKQKEERRDTLQKEKRLADIYSGLSHDIRTPLTSMDGYVQLLKECEDEETRLRYYAIIQERIAGLKDILEELFTYTKLKNEAYRLEMSEICVNQVLKKTIFAYYEDWTGRGIEPLIDITDKPLYINGNLQGLRRTIQNIVKNALDHGKNHISISLKEENAEIILKVSNEVDNPEEIDTTQVFERFYKSDKARSKTSTGLGLAIAKEFVSKMNGVISAEIEGNTFSVVIRFGG